MKKTLRKEKGITLIALVVTVIVLIILAGVSINLVLGENGIVTIAKRAKENTELAKVEEETRLNELVKQLEEGTSGNTTNPPETIKTVEEVKGGDYFNKLTTIKDNNGNLIKVPEGFKIAEDSGINVTEGIVIEDNDIIDGIGNNRGNQYVWIPVGNGIKKADGTIVDITLGRYEFASNGTPKLKQSAENYADEVLIGSYYKEIATSRIGIVDTKNHLNDTNTTALNLKGFVDSVKANGGYYIARYEASYGTDGKANSKVSNSYSATAPTKEGTLWNYITQINAATASRNLYEIVTTDLINSYAWDTAMVYIQNFSGDTDYSIQDGKSINSSLTNTGANKDEVCKINDMASNTYEWTTEYSTIIVKDSPYASPCTCRGGYCDHNASYTSRRYDNTATYGLTYNGFRPILYM